MASLAHYGLHSKILAFVFFFNVVGRKLLIQVSKNLFLADGDMWSGYSVQAMDDNRWDYGAMKSRIHGAWGQRLWLTG